MPGEPERGTADVVSAVLLCAASGVVDAVGYVHSGLFAANMTGNTVLTGIALAQRDWPHAIEGALVLVWFFAGAMAGRFLWDAGGARPLLPLCAEAAILALCAFVDLRAAFALGLLAFAMGIQAAAIARFAGTALSTVVVTSTIVKLAEANLDALVRLSGARITKERVPIVLLLATWLAYGVGAVVAILASAASYVSVALSAGLVIVVLVLRKDDIRSRA